MRLRSLAPIFLALVLAPPMTAQEAGGGEEKPAEPAAAEKKPFEVGDVIHPVVAKMPVPQFNDRIVATRMAISTRSEEAERHVLQGMALIHAAWDFEAYRHFCAAAQIDPDCVMAYWGIALSLAAPGHEFVDQRVAAIRRMLQLVEALGDDLPLIEQEYAIAVAQLFSLEPGQAAETFEGIVERFPRNLQAGLLATFLKREGYTEFGDALWGQEQAIKKMKEYLDKYPDNLSVLTFWAMLHAEAPDAQGDLRQNVLPHVRKMVKLVPDFPPYQHLLGHFEWRCGNHQLARQAFEKAGVLFENYMERNKVDHHDCETWVRSRMYLAMTLYSQGEIQKALEVAGEVAKLRVDKDRVASPGANVVLWEARTLPTRLYLGRGAAADLDQAVAALPGKEDDQLFKESSLSVFYLEGLRQYAEGRKAILGGKVDDARLIREALAMTGSSLIEQRRAAARSSAMSEYFRAVRSLEILALELRGLIALQGDKVQRGSAFNWFRSATDKQFRPSMLVPPAIPYPMELRLADFHLQAGEPRKAAEVFQAGLERRPNDLALLTGYHEALTRLGRSDDAARIQKQIDLVRGK